MTPIGYSEDEEFDKLPPPTKGWLTQGIVSAKRRIEYREQADVNYWRVNEIKRLLALLHSDNKSEILAKINATITVNDSIARLLLMGRDDGGH